MARTIGRSLLMASVFAATAVAQDSVLHAVCRDPHPAPTCGSCFLFEYMGALRLAGTEVTRSATDHDALRSWFAWDVGAMKNRTASTSLGASLGIGGSADGVRIALRARRRQWLDHDMVFDVGAGPLMTMFQRGGAEGEVATYGATADVGAGRARLGLITLSADVARQRGTTQFATHLGARTESRGVVIVSIIAAIGGVLVASTRGFSGYAD